MTPILGASGLGRRGRTTTASSHEHTDSSTSSRRHSSSSNGRKASQASSQMDDWSDGFTGIVDLDRRMRELAMAEQGLTMLGGSDGLDVYESYSPPAASWEQQQQQQGGRRKSSSDARSGSTSQSSLATGRSIPCFTHAPSISSTAATSRFSQDSRAHSSLLSKRRSSTANTVDSFDSAHSSLRLAPLPASPSAFGNYRLTDGSSLSIPTRQSGAFSSPSWSSLDEQDPLTPLAAVTRNLEPITPGTAAAATWTDPSAPGYFPAGLSADHHHRKRKNRSLRKKPTTARRAPLPRLVSGEVVSSPAAECDSHFEDSLFSDSHPKTFARQDHLGLPADTCSETGSRPPSPTSSTDALKRSAQSLALSLRFKMLRAKRKVKKTGQGAAELFAGGHASQRSSIEGASLST
ncbi:uncharacterized protein UTRI_00273 [Ustilago trichophora]|uniref:Uncharacterized protein n=1 Tax=Ustilago trichophora TaxID=86804 RepID=A0A5C3DUG2_9BASI|nr:uncharacterized protein UTRI_00273 [Ustilago trichophora]